MKTEKHRQIAQIIPGLETADGAGVKLIRSIGQRQDLRLDPFLMLDAFSTENPDDYIAGFPPHPHRGFETVTYMIEGRMLHEDHMGNQGNLGPGDVQWMTAGRGVIHSEMPQQVDGAMRGFQLWLNLPANEKMQAAAYRDISADDIPALTTEDAVVAKVIAGTLQLSARTVSGPINNPAMGEGAVLKTDPLIADIMVPAGQSVDISLPNDYNAMIQVFEGQAQIAGQSVEQQQAVVLAEGDVVRVTADEQPIRFLLLAGRPLNEPIVQRGPFVMNTQAEIRQAMLDYGNGTLTSVEV